MCFWITERFEMRRILKTFALIGLFSWSLSLTAFADDWLQVDFSSVTLKNPPKGWKIPDTIYYVDVDSFTQKGRIWDKDSGFSVKFKTEGDALKGYLDTETEPFTVKGKEIDLPMYRFRFNGKRQGWTNIVSAPPVVGAIITTLINEGVLRTSD